MAVRILTGKAPLPELKRNSLAEIGKYLKIYGLVADDDKIVSLSSIGRTSMNSTVKVQMEKTSLIIKKSRTWVESYPTLPCPNNLYRNEHTYFQMLDHLPALIPFSPKVLAIDPNAKVLIQEDLGSGMDSFHIFQNKPLDESFLDQLLLFIKTLHKVSLQSLDEVSLKTFSGNYFAKEFFFVTPFSRSLSDLFRPEMDCVEEVYKLHVNQKFKDKLEEVNQDFDVNQNVLAHGTFHPGNWLNMNGTLKVINFEFCRVAPSEFDLGVLCAYLLISGKVDQLKKVIASFPENDTMYRKKFINYYCSIEIIRRMNGYGNLMKTLKPAQRKDLFAKATANLVDDSIIF